jgi:4-hydroxybenzoyl-CoA thioesterase
VWQSLAAACGKLTLYKAFASGGLTAMSAFQREILVRFGHCDAAGWVFYPRYFEMISDFVEDWFEDGLAASAPGLFHHKQILTPSVHFTVDFVKPTRYGDRLTFFLWTTKIGTSSVELRIEASHQGELRMRVKQVLVFISAHTSRSTPIPPELVSRMHRFQTDDAEVPATSTSVAEETSKPRRRKASRTAGSS